jgi:UDP-GlcNAc3NAcA epimerase
MKIATIIGARPQFIKAAAISRAIAAHNRLTPDSSPLTLLKGGSKWLPQRMKKANCMIYRSAI